MAWSNNKGPWQLVPDNLLFLSLFKCNIPGWLWEGHVTLKSTKPFSICGGWKPRGWLVDIKPT